MAEVAALFSALEVLTNQVKSLAEQQQTRGGKPWYRVDHYRNIEVFSGDSKDYEEFATKLRSQIAAGNPKVSKLMACVEKDCSEEMLARGRYDEAEPEFDEEDADFIVQSSNEMFNLLLNMTTGEANAMVRRCQGQGWLAWKKLTASLNPRTLASGIKKISAVLSPGKITQTGKADVEIEQWEDAMIRLSVEYGQQISAKMKVAVLYSMLPKDLQEKVLDECSVNWDGINETEAAEKFMKIKSNVKNLAKSRREMMGPKPMEVDRVKASWADWAEDDWDTLWGKTEPEKDDHDTGTNCEEHAFVQYIGAKGGKKGGKGFQGHCYVCGEFGHSQWDCRKGKGKGFGKDGGGKGYGKNMESAKGNWNYKGHGKGDYKGGYYNKGSGKGAMQRACFGCGAFDHVIKDCPKNPRIQQVEEETPEVLFIGNVKGEEWKHVPMKVRFGDYVKAPIIKDKAETHCNRFRVLEVDEEDDEEEIVQVRAVECEPCRGCHGTIKYHNGVESVKNVMAVETESRWVSLGKGDIVVDSAADESCWPVGQGDAFPTKPSRRSMILKTANGEEMEHYGQKEVTFEHENGRDIIGLTFQVTDVKKPLLAVRRLVEKGNKVVLSGEEGQSYILNEKTKVKVPVKKKGGSFVIEAHFVKEVASDFTRPA